MSQEKTHPDLLIWPEHPARERIPDHAQAPATGGNRNRNVFEVLMVAERVCSLEQITNALFEVGGKYRRNM